MKAPMYEVSLKPADLKVCRLRHKAESAEAVKIRPFATKLN